LGKVLDKRDELDLWKDTMLIVNTDHGFLLGEHGWRAKCIQPFYNEVARTPLFIWDPRGGRANKRCDCLVQLIDIAPTLLVFFHLPIPKDLLGKPLRETLASDVPVREAALFGMHSGYVNCTDGNTFICERRRFPIVLRYNYTLMPTHMFSMFSVKELREMELSEPFRFTKGLQTMKVPARIKSAVHEFGTLLYDLQTDPEQLKPIEDPDIEAAMIRSMVQLMQQNDAPVEQYERLGLRYENKG
jgi:hypothetical protein